jgi:hypothetical protein
VSKDGKINLNSDVLDENNELFRVISIKDEIIKEISVF